MKGHYLTKPERMFWEECKNQGIEIEKQYPLKYSFILDFAFPDKKIAIEIDGNHWHGYPHGTKRDKMKTAILKRNGWTIIRFWESDVYKDVNRIVKSIRIL